MSANSSTSVHQQQKLNMCQQCLTSNMGTLGSSSMLRSCSTGVLDGSAGVGSTL